ncbi:MAG: hypothetical protein IPI46_12085 [Bacteroidetes bacterium]|nr:hypothetical protein [Bacteroidota bacterium]
MKKITLMLKALFTLVLSLFFYSSTQAQYVSIPVTGFNNDIVANGVGSSTIVGTTYPAIGVDGAMYSFHDNTFKYTAASALPTCFFPVSNTAASLRTAGLTYQFEPYTANNALTIDNNSTTYLTSPFANTGTLTLNTPTSYGKLFVLYETVVNVSPMVVDVVVTFTDATTQSFPANACVNWFTTTLPAYSGMGRTTPAGAIQCGATPNMFELQLSIDPSNSTKLVQSITFTLPASYTTGTTASTVNYFHALAVGGIAPCTTPPDQASALNLSSPSGTVVNGSFTAASSAPSGYLAVGYLAGSTPTLPVSGTTYTLGASLGTGKIVGVGASTSLSATGLFPGVSYDVYIYSYNSGPCATAYNTSSPLTGTITTSSVGASLLINPYLEGGFESGATLASNGWNVVNAATNAWTVGTVPTGFTNQSAYISNNGGAAWAFTNNSVTASHIYKDITFPAGENEIVLSFNWKALGEASAWDALIVYTCPTTITPIASSPTGTGNAATWTGGSPTAIGAQLWNQGTNLQTFTACLPASFAGTTQRIVLTWKNDGSGGVNPPAAVDNISLVSSVPVGPVDQATALTLTTISTSQIDVSYTAAATPPAGYVVVRYPNGATPTPPVTGTNYTLGNLLGSGTVVYIGTGTSFSSTGLLGSTTYDYYVYTYSTSTCAGNVYNVVSPLSGSQTTNACGTIGGTFAVGPTAPASPAGFPTLTAALAYISTNGLGSNTILELQNDYTSAYAATNETYPIVLPFNACINATKTLTIQPAATVTAPIIFSSASTQATFVFDGGSFVTIDGRPGGSGTDKFISIVNTSATAASAGNAVVMRNEATSNTLTFLDLSASNLNPATNAGTMAVGAVPGVVAIHSTTGIGGNDNNTISNCNIHTASTSGNLLNVGVYAYNNTTVGSAANNDNNTITSCNFYDIFHASAATAAIDILVGNNNWTISDNSYYQTASRTYATTAQTHRGFWITPGASALGSSGYTITGNYIGGTAANCGGTAYTMLGSIATLFQGMDVSVGTLSATNILNNTIQNIALTTTSTGNYFIGIGIASGNVNIGNAPGTGNTIGSATGNGSIVLNNSTTSSTASIAAGIRLGGGPTATINYNSIGSITINNGAFSNTFVGINVVGGGTSSNTITNNLIGSLSTANSIQTTGTGVAATAMGMSGIFVSSGPTNSTVSNNTIANLHSSYTGTSTTTALGMRGIDVVVGANTISNNTVRNLTSNSAAATSGNASAICGIVMRSTTAPTTISGNSIHTLKLTGTSTTAAMQISGLVVSCATTGSNLVSKNNIHSLSLTPANNAVTITGITVSAGSATYANNMIRLGFTELGAPITSGIQLRGITKGTAVANNFYHNSIYIGGTGVVSSTLNSFAFQRSTAPTALPNDEVLNNIFVNERSNASTGGKHYVFSASANTFLTTNFNDYYYTGNGGVFGLNVAADVAVYTPGWITGDLNSLSSDPIFINATGDAVVGDLHINPAVQTAIEQGGTFVSAVLDDIDNQTRSSLSPVDMGADAGNFLLLNPCTGVPGASTATLTNTSVICGSGTKTMYLAGFTGQPGNSYKWQESVSGLLGSFTDVTTGLGANTSSYTTAALTSSMYFQCVVYCTLTGDSTVSSSVQAIVTPAPTLVVTPASGTSVCSGANVDLAASGANTYTWTCNPGVGGYPMVSLLSTPNNLATVTARPTSTLASGTGAPPATVATPTWIYTVVGTDAGGCTSSASITLNVITSANIPLELNYTATPTSVCAPGTPVTFDVTHIGTIGSGQWVYNWYDAAGTTLLQSTTSALSTDSYTPATPSSVGNKVFMVKLSNTACPSSYAVASPSIFVGYTALNIATNANCGDNGIIVSYPEGSTDMTPWYVNDFSTGLQGAAFDAAYGNCNFTGGRCNITNQANGVNGTFLVRNPSSINTNNLTVNFKMSTAPRGFAFNILGADGMAWSYAPDVWQGTLTPGTGGFNAEGGSGTGFKLAFDATANGAINTPGAYLMYNCTTPDQGPSSPGVLAFKQGSFWQGLVNAPVSIQISENGYVTVSINNQIIFDHVPLPTAYLTANKSNWLHAFTARTGGSNQLHAIDDLNISYGTYEYSNNSTNGLDGSWQTENTFNGLSAGTYNIWVRNPNDPNCFSNTGSSIIGTSPSPSSAFTVPASGYQDVVCYNNTVTLTTDIFVPGATFLWEQSASASGPWTTAPGISNQANYTTDPLTVNTYFRLNFTCPASSTVTATPLLVTVNAGSIASTNSPQMVNCIGDSVTVTAVPGPNTTCVWYTTATGGSPVANGNSYTAAPTTLPTTYYVEPVTTVYSNHYVNGGQTIIGNTFGTATSGTGISTRFTTTASILIDSIKVNPGAAGTLVVALQNAGSATNISSFSFTVTAAMVGSFVNVPVNLTVPGSGNYQLTTTGVTCAYYSPYTGTYAASYMSLGGVFSITGGSTTATGAASTTVYGTCFRWAISSSCPAGSGARIPVLVTNNPAFDINITSNTSAFCAGTIESLAASSSNPYSSYTWTPITDLYIDAAATIPYTAALNLATVYAKPSSGGLKTYTVSTAGSGCSNSKSVILNVISIPNVSATASPASACTGGNVQMNAFIPSGVYTISSVPFAPEAVPATASTVTGDESTQTVNLGFNFGYFGSIYTNAIIHTNGYIQLGGSTPVCLTCYTPPAAPATGNPNNWVGIWADMSVTAGQVTYGMSGVAPNRKFVVNYNNVNYFSATPASTHQIILNEADNSVEIHVTSNVTTATNARALAIENASGTVAYVPTGRNSGTWTASNEAWKFTPVVGNYTFDWTANSTYLSATNIANPIAQAMVNNQTYTVVATDVNTGCTNTAVSNVIVNMPSSSNSTVSLPCGSSYVWNSNTYTTTGIYTITTMNVAGCDSVQTLDLTINPCNTVLNLTCFIQGYWDGTSQMQAVLANQGEPTTLGACDSIDVELHSDVAPYGVDASVRTVLQQNGTATCIFPPATGNKYIVVKHRSAVQTWSANPVTMGTSVAYNFSTAANQAYGDNQVQISTSPSIWALYTGDIVIDENIDLLDLGTLETEISNFSFGYIAADVNGDGNVDLLDSPVVEQNISNFIFSNHP